MLMNGLFLLLIAIPLLILFGIYKLYKIEADKKDKKVNYLLLTFTFIPFGIFFGFFLLVLVHGRTGF